MGDARRSTAIMGRFQAGDPAMSAANRMMGRTISDRALTQISAGGNSTDMMIGQH
jgi:hypothetical protein